jgi:hypothetical protein
MGPTMATTASAPRWVGMFSSCATPPSSQSVMRFVRTP